MFQLLADVSGDDATSVQLQFDIEAWDDATNSRTDDPGQGGFLVHLDVDRGNGFESLADWAPSRPTYSLHPRKTIWTATQRRTAFRLIVVASTAPFRRVRNSEFVGTSTETRKSITGSLVWIMSVWPVRHGCCG